MKQFLSPTSFRALLFDPSEDVTSWGEADFRKLEFRVPRFPFNTPHLVPCSGHAALPDGGILFAGGEGPYPIAAQTTILNPDLLSVDATGQVTCNDCWITQEPMPDVPNIDNSLQICPFFDASENEDPTMLKSARYYPTVTALSDGRMLVMGGASESEGCQLNKFEGANTPMIFNPNPPSGESQWTKLLNGRGLPGPGMDSSSPNSPNMDGCESACRTDEVFQFCYCKDLEPLAYRGAAQYAADWDAFGNENIPNRFHVHYYPHNFLLSNGGVFMAGSLAGPYGLLAGEGNIKDPCNPSEHPHCAGITQDGPVTGVFNTNASGSWSNLIQDKLAVRQGATVMYRPNKLLKAGGSIANATLTNMVSVIDLNAANPEWSDLSETSPLNMNWARRGNNLVILPDGNVLAANGAEQKMYGGHPHAVPVNIDCPEIWNPNSQTWSIMASMDKPCIEGAPCDTGEECCVDNVKVCCPGLCCNDEQKGNVHVRADHSEAILLPDARVLVLGGEYHADGRTPGNSSAQIFSPPYLFAPDGSPAYRPSITKVGPAKNQLVYGQVGEVDTLDAYEIESVALIRLGATTHGFDQEQRYVPLTYRPRGQSGALRKYLEIDPPTNGNEAPPGFYMLFILKNGVPSVAKMVRLRHCAAGDPGPDCNNNGSPDWCDIATRFAMDCNDNEIPDSCDINTGASIDCDANGIPDECPCSNCPCPLGLISTTVAASPPHLTRDARQPHPPNDNRLAARQGIGSAGEPITITMMNPLCGNVGPQCFGLCETGIEQTDGTPMDGVALTANEIVSVTKRASPDKTYDIVLARPISAGHWTTIKYWSGSKRIIYSSLPGDVNIDGVSQSSSPSDVDYLTACTGTPSLCSTVYRRDIDRSGAFPSGDVERLNLLLAGSETFIEWEGRMLPNNICNQSGGGGPYCPDANCGGGTDPQAMFMGFGLENFGEMESLEDGPTEIELTLIQEHSNALAELLTISNPTTAAELDFFETSVAT